MDQRIGSYQRARRKFACIVYAVTLLWLILALVQWILVSVLADVRDIFIKYEWISVIFFALSITIVFIFVFVEESRFVIALNWILALLIVEFAIVGVFALVAKSLWPDIAMWFAICVLLEFLCVVLGSLIPHDLTLDVVIMFVISFVFLILSVFLIMLYVLTLIPYTFLIYQVFVSVVILTFVMYHAQTIGGGRFAEMRINDYLLATIILFYDFVIIFLMTFYVQIQYKIASKHVRPEGYDDITSTSVSPLTASTSD